MAGTVYFVGAGLSKSLEVPRRPIPLMLDFVSVMADYLHDDVILAALHSLEQAALYSRESKEARAASDSIARQVSNNIRQVTPEQRERFRQALKNRPLESIGDLLLKADRLLSGRGANSHAEKLPQGYRYAINRLFHLIGWDVNWCFLEKFVQSRLEDRGPHTFISFNYDLLLDRVIQRHADGWTVQKGYGFDIRYSLEAQTHETRILPECGPGNVLVLKPHGSLNWLAREKEPIRHGPGGTMFEDGPVTVFSGADGEIAYLWDDATFKGLWLPDEASPRHVEVYLMPPDPNAKKESGNLSFVQEIRRREEQAIAEADEVYVIGWSMPATDDDQEGLIRTAVGKRVRQFASITVVSLGAEPSYFRRAADMFGVSPSSMRVCNNGFAAFASAL